MKKMVMVVLGVVGAMVAGAATIDVTQANFGSYRILTNGNTYRFIENIDWTAPATESAMKVAEGANVVIEIANGVVVSLTGGAANGISGAGAGIEVPSNAKLTITGSGALYVNGGNAANGVTGGYGYDSFCPNISECIIRSASGGGGGNGGGGAGAGIGGRGGNGGAGGVYGAAKTAGYYDGGSYASMYRNGDSGQAGGQGSAGGTCGAVSVRGTATVIAKGGAAANAGDGGSHTGEVNGYNGIALVSGGSQFAAGYCGGGGGGGGGFAAADVGGGGAGGGGGGGGGSGGILCHSTWYILQYMMNGAGGGGGKGAVDGGVGHCLNGASSSKYWRYDNGTGGTYDYPVNGSYESWGGGVGGAGGAAGAMGGNGSLTVELTAICGCGTRSAYSVGKISDTEYIRWENEKLWRVKDGVYTEIAYETVQGWTGNLDGGKWYVVKGIVHRTDSINVGEGEAANLVLLDSAALTVDCGLNLKHTGIWVPSGRALNIFGVESGSLTATGGDWAAGIGGGPEQSMGALTIYGGTVTATGGNRGAGIGGGEKGTGGTVTINGGTITATGGWNGADIGGGYYGAGGTVTINGGTVTASSISNSPKLGPRVFKIDDNHYREGVSVSFHLPPTLRLASAVVDNGALVNTATQDGITSVCFLPAPCVTLNFALVDADSHFVGDSAITLGPVREDVTLETSALPQVVENVIGSVAHVLPDGGEMSASEVRPVHQTEAFGTKLSDGWHVVTGMVTRTALEVSGVVNLILADGATLKVNGGIRVNEGNALNIFCQREATGKLVANGSENCAGIGGGNRGTGGTVNINGGVVTATSGWNGAGIGGGFKGNGGIITINGGTVTATGGKYGAGIGGGYQGVGGTVTINGGTVTATGAGGGAGVGGGWDGAGGTVTIDGGSIKASSIQSQPKNTAGSPVYCVTVPCATLPCEISRLRDYGTKDIVPIDGNIYLYLPEGEYIFTVNGVTYRVVVNSAATTVDIYPTCEGGEIAEGEDGVWVITPNEGVEEVTIGNLPEEAKVTVKLNGYNVPSSAFMGFGEGGIFSLALNPEVVVPMIGEVDAGEPFVVGEGGVALTIKTIAGLKYSLIRGAEIGAITDTVIEPTIATEAEMTLKDENPPTNKAFYKVGVGK